jgi:integrase
MPTITEKFIRELKANDISRRTIIADADLPGFALRVNESGKMVFIFRYRHRGQQKTFTIGSTTALTASQARQEAKKIAGDVARGIDPNAAKQEGRSIPLFREIAADHLKTAQKKSLEDDESKIERVLVPKIGNRPIDSITTQDIRRLLKSLSDKGLTPATVNRYRALLSVLFQRAIESGCKITNPVSPIKPLPENNARDRFLNEDECRRLIAALDDEPENSARCITMMLATGARRGNVMAMEWADVDLDRSIWTIPVTKNGKKLRVPLNDMALSILEEQRKNRELGNPYVFPGLREGKPLTTVQQTWKRAIEKAGIANIRLHDLRHTFASHAVLNGTDLYTVSKLLGHHSPTMSARYAHLTDDALRKASNSVVVPLDERRRKKSQ